MMPMIPASLYWSMYGFIAAVTSGLAGGSVSSAKESADITNSTRVIVTVTSLLLMGWFLLIRLVYSLTQERPHNTDGRSPGKPLPAHLCAAARCGEAVSYTHLRAHET